MNQDFLVLVGDKEETFGEQSKNTVCGKFPKYPTGSPLLPYEWVTISCETNSSLSGRFVTIQKSLDHDQLFACRVPYPKYPDRLEFSEIEVVYADMSKDNIIYNILHIFQHCVISISHHVYTYWSQSWLLLPAAEPHHCGKMRSELRHNDNFIHHCTFNLMLSLAFFSIECWRRQ